MTANEAHEAIALSQAARGLLKALTSETRQQILMLFTGGAELTVGQVAERLTLAQSAASTQLAILREGGVLVSRREWKTVYYRVDAAQIDQALSDLQACLHACCPPTGCAPDACG
ncbi:ArsR/SmtB family transcription factor [Planobispora longispora]|uniref:HTH arsR-type domain-containing protein n=1 Tax=Planobispora longispora TaxID=28887 RepID=A0A8J3RM49_9ACTN|nr:metalloregulator ArsR/SmtB family transcription factor [Planobispora longispora]GIH78202.1 hypothetical protein Plo01_46310 [Planobispora longispora]